MRCNCFLEFDDGVGVARLNVMEGCPKYLPQRLITHISYIENNFFLLLCLGGSNTPKDFEILTQQKGDNMEILILLVTFGILTICFLGMFLIMSIAYNKQIVGLALIGVLSYFGFMSIMLGVIKGTIII